MDRFHPRSGLARPGQPHHTRVAEVGIFLAGGAQHGEERSTAGTRPSLPTGTAAKSQRALVSVSRPMRSATAAPALTSPSTLAVWAAPRDPGLRAKAEAPNAGRRRCRERLAAPPGPAPTPREYVRACRPSIWRRLRASATLGRRGRPARTVPPCAPACPGARAAGRVPRARGAPSLARAGL